MNIFEWIYKGRFKTWSEEDPRLASLVYRLPSMVVDDQHGQVDAMAPELVSLAKARKDAWLEVYARHWHLQSLVFKRLDVRDALAEAVSLVERAHRPDAIGCPQSVCATQDLCAAYGFRDGPAYVNERLEASQGTLDRIDPSWPCWRCITAEYAGALLDGERADEALAYLEDNLAKLRAVKPETTRDEYAGTWIRALVKLGRLDEALAFNETAENDAAGEHFVNARTVERAWLLAQAGRFAEAVESLPDWGDLVEPTPSYYDWWSETVCLAVEAGALTFERAHFEALLGGFRRLASTAAAWTAWLVGERLARCMLVADWTILDAVLDELEAVANDRREPGPSLARVAELRAQSDANIARAKAAITLPGSAAETLARFEAEGPRFLEALMAVERWPEVARLTNTVAQHWRVMGFPAKAEAALNAYLAHTPDALSVWGPLAELLLETERLDALDAVLAPRMDTPAAGLLAARALKVRGQASQALAALDAWLDAHDDDRGWVYDLRAEWRKEAGAWAAALADCDAAIERGVPVGNVDWRAAVLATSLQDWARVRVAAGRLGMTLSPGEGPIDEAWELVQVRYDESARPTIWAQRLGPVHARVIQADGPGRSQRYHDVVVFDPRPLNPEAREAERPVFEYAVERVLEPGNRQTFGLHGAHPGEAVLDALRADLEAVGGELSVLNGAQYQLQHPESGEPVPGLYAVITAAAGVEPGPIAGPVRAHLAGHPIVWPELASAAEAERHRVIEAEWKL